MKLSINRGTKLSMKPAQSLAQTLAWSWAWTLAQSWAWSQHEVEHKPWNKVEYKPWHKVEHRASTNLNMNHVTKLSSKLNMNPAWCWAQTLAQSLAQSQQKVEHKPWHKVEHEPCHRFEDGVEHEASMKLSTNPGTKLTFPFYNLIGYLITPPHPNAKFPPITTLLNRPTYHKSAKVSPSSVKITCWTVVWWW